MLKVRVVGHGIDLVDVARVRHLLESRPDDFLDGCFTRAEQEDGAHEDARETYFAARYAAKEAVVKALGTGFTSGISWLDVEIRRLGSGAPHVVLSGRALEVSHAAGISRFLISLSDESSFAVASVIAISDA
jgi:holo-[acyl-carrier protein] synthase